MLNLKDFFSNKVPYEQCYILTGKLFANRWWYGHLGLYSKGSAGGVIFDYQYVLDHPKNVVGWIHTHPPNASAHYSQTDDKTMRAWVFALGKPFVCCIVGHEGIRSFLYYHDEKDPIEGKVRRIKRCLVGCF